MSDLPWLLNDSNKSSPSPSNFEGGGLGPCPFGDYYNYAGNTNNNVTFGGMGQPTAAATATTATTTMPTSATNKYDWRLHSLMLCRHIFTRGLIDGIGSDISVHVPAWGKVYNLHRIILDQNPYFSSLLQGGFQESSSDSVTLHFENNPFITKNSFYFVLAQLYGKLYDPDIHADNVRQILATCSFFQLEHMAELCVQFISQTLDENNVIQYLTFADEHIIFGCDRILNNVFTYLCRELYSLRLETVAQLPVHWLKKIIESDALWVPSEYDRYKFVTRILGMRHTIYRHQEEEEEYVDQDEYHNPSSSSSSSDIEKDSYVDDIEVVPSPDDLHKQSDFEALDQTTEGGNNLKQELDVYEAIISRSIHYIHMTFEQLDSIRSDMNPFTRQPLVPDRLLKDALWQQISLRSKIENASERDQALDLTVSRAQYEQIQQKQESSDLVPQPPLLQPIPVDDMTTYTGESTFSWPTSAVPETQKLRAAQHPATAKQQSTTTANNIKDTNKQYALYPPFRFSVEFTDFATLKHNVRVYSKTVFYAGSNWNMYIQKTRSQRKGVLQLGVYLHRQSIPCGPCNHILDGTNPAPSTTIHLPGAANHQQCARRCTPELSTFSRYADKRKIVKTWFKIFCPSRGPKHSMTLFQSSPDNFSVLQSWGWRSTTLCADEALSSSHHNSQRISHSDDHQQRSSPSATESITINNTTTAPTTTTTTATTTTAGGVQRTSTNTVTVASQQHTPRITRSNSNHGATANSTQRQSEINDSPAATVDVPASISTLRFSIVMGHV
ncbi:hypothetical protein BDB00DRAFT_512321 [Zychaea mexicana]|uniref:uncharacterized protein n=1 Tax=Zychaea mexicana TaxID=64656 RepID=UPI0022FED566|nr:uncharacterized protein BDB00DRAFT_512321 [Zychaea mexicana]KAI9491217.1 hypothetical protein BDB00DRAFT_512321 [Zychaea mexicana]